MLRAMAGKLKERSVPPMEDAEYKVLAAGQVGSRSLASAAGAAAIGAFLGPGGALAGAIVGALAGIVLGHHSTHTKHQVPD